MNQHSEQRDLFKTPQQENGFPPITIELRGLELTYEKDGQKHILRGIPSFKTGKMAIGWRDKMTGRIMARPLTLPEHKRMMELITLSIESQLRSALNLTTERIQMVACPRSLIASLMPLDDAWTWLREISVRSDLCGPGEEGATITIQRIK